MQTTIKSSVQFGGIGLHSGQAVRLTLHPAPADHGIWFRRTDLDRSVWMIPARWNAVSPSELSTRLVNADGAEVNTVEHVMAALAGCGIHNARLDIDGPEVPILDGSAAQFVQAILAAGIRQLQVPVRVIEVRETIEVRHGAAWARLEPAEGFEIAFKIDFEDAAIGQQDKFLNMANGAFVRELCASRTFCRQADVDAMRARGLALGGSLDNAIVVDGDSVLTPGGLRYADEAVRHKMLDALGDLALAGAPLLGRYTGNRAGHAMTNRLLRRLFAAPEAWAVRLCDRATALRLPGVGVDAHDIPQVA